VNSHQLHIEANPKKLLSSYVDKQAKAKLFFEIIPESEFIDLQI
jgi:hypothetical protein